jgi:hypothetical protein
VTYDGTTIINIRRSNVLIENQPVQEINIISGSAMQQSINIWGNDLQFVGNKTRYVYYNFGDVITPIEIQYNDYYDPDSEMSYQDVVCTNLYNGHTIAYDEIVAAN